jgi:hypothetical protein
MAQRRPSGPEQSYLTRPDKGPYNGIGTEYMGKELKDIQEEERQYDVEVARENRLKRMAIAATGLKYNSKIAEGPRENQHFHPRVLKTRSVGTINQSETIQNLSGSRTPRVLKTRSVGTINQSETRQNPSGSRTPRVLKTRPVSIAYVKSTNSTGGKYSKNIYKNAGKKEILGKNRVIYKMKGSNKEYVKSKGMYIPISEYKKLKK